MDDPKDIPPPQTASELQELLRSGKFKIEFAPTELVNRYAEQVDKILIAIGRYMAADDEDSVASQEDAEEWANGCGVSDMSCIGDFMLIEKHVEVISAELGVAVASKDYFYAVAARMAGAN